MTSLWSESGKSYASMPQQRKNEEYGQTYLSAGNAPAPKFNAGGNLALDAPKDQQLMQFFGIPNKFIQENPYLQHKEENQALPQAYIGENAMLSVIMITGIVKADHWMVKEMLPWTEHSGSMEIVWDRWYFNDAMMGRTPEESVSRLLSTSYSTDRAYVVRYGLALLLEHGFYHTAKGRISYKMNLLQIRHAVIETCSYGAMIACLQAKPYVEKNRAYRSGNGNRDANSMDNRLRDEIDNWDIIKKSKGGFGHMHENLESELTIQGGGAPNMFIYPKGTRKFIMDARASEPFYLNGKAHNVGGLRPEDHSNLPAFYESREFKLGEGQQPDDPCYREQSIGGRHYMLNTHIKDMKLEDYQTRHMNVCIYNERIDDWTVMSYADNVQYCGLYDNWDSENPTLSRVLGQGFMKKYQTWGTMIDKAGIMPKVVTKLQNLPARKRQEFLTKFAGYKPDPIAVQPHVQGSTPDHIFNLYKPPAADNPFKLSKLHRPEGLSADEVIQTGLMVCNAAVPLNAAEQMAKFEEIRNPVVNDCMYGGISVWLAPSGPDGKLTSATSLSFGLSNYALLLQYPHSKQPGWINKPEQLNSFITGVFSGTAGDRAVAQLAGLTLSAVAQFPKQVTAIKAAVKAFSEKNFGTGKDTTVLAAFEKYCTGTPLYDYYAKPGPVLQAALALFKAVAPNEALEATLTKELDTYLAFKPVNHGVARMSFYDAAVSLAQKEADSQGKDGAHKQMLKAESAVAAIHEIVRLGMHKLNKHDTKRAQLSEGFSTIESSLIDLYCIVVRDRDTTKNYLTEFDFLVLGVILNNFIAFNEPSGRDEVFAIINALAHHHTDADAKALCNYFRTHIPSIDTRLTDVEDAAKSFCKSTTHLAKIAAFTKTVSSKHAKLLDRIRAGINSGMNVTEDLNKVQPSGSSAAPIVTLPVINTQTIRELSADLALLYRDKDTTGDDIFQGLFTASSTSALNEKKVFQQFYEAAKKHQSQIPEHIFNAEAAAAWYSGNKNALDTLTSLTNIMSMIPNATDAKSSISILHLANTNRLPLPKRLDDPSKRKEVDPCAEPVVRRYSDEDIKKMLYTISVDSGAVWKWFIENDIPVPIGLMGFRPHQRYIMGSGFALTSGGQTGRTFYMMPNFQLADNVAQKMIYGHFTMYNKSLILAPQKLLRALNIISKKYVDGNGVRVWDPLSRRDVEDYRAGKCTKDIFYFPVLVNHVNKSWYTDCTGVFHKNWNADAAAQKETNFESANLYSQFWGMKCLKDPNETGGVEGGSRFNTLCIQEHQFGYTAYSQGRMDKTEINKGHFGPDRYAGVGLVVNGKKGEYYKECNYDNSGYGENRVRLV